MSTLRTLSVNEVIGKKRIAVDPVDNRYPLPNCHIGLEIEAENVNVNSNGYSSAGWDIKTDGSLRNNGREFVFQQPTAGTGITRALDWFFGSRGSERNVTYVTNPRAGTHIHVNWTDVDNMDSIYKLVGLLYCIEGAVYDMVDINRKWCGFCSRLSEMSVDSLRTLMTTNSKLDFVGILRGNGRNRYFGANLMSLFKYGTVEFRYFPCPDSREQVESWINLCQLIKKTVTETPLTLEEMMARLSTPDGIEGFINEYFDFADINRELLANLDLVAAARRVANFLYLVNLRPVRMSANVVPGLLSKSAERVIQKRLPDLAVALKRKADAAEKMNAALARSTSIEGSNFDDLSAAIIEMASTFSATR